MENIGVIKKNPQLEDLIYFFICKTNNKGLSQKKIQKLCYYAQAWSLVLNDSDIVKGIKFEAWVHGPVNPKIRYFLRKYSYQDITLENYNSEIASGIKDKFSSDALEVLELVWNAYGKFSANRLEEMTHLEAPWKETRQKSNCINESDECNELIPNELIKKYFTDLYRRANQ